MLLAHAGRRAVFRDKIVRGMPVTRFVPAPLAKANNGVHRYLAIARIVTPSVGVTGIPPLTAFLFGPLVCVAAPVQDADALMRETPERSAGDLTHLLLDVIVPDMFNLGRGPAEWTRQQNSGGYLHSAARSSLCHSETSLSALALHPRTRMPHCIFTHCAVLPREAYRDSAAITFLRHERDRTLLRPPAEVRIHGVARLQCVCFSCFHFVLPVLPTQRPTRQIQATPLRCEPDLQRWAPDPIRASCRVSTRRCDAARQRARPFDSCTLGRASALECSATARGRIAQPSAALYEEQPVSLIHQGLVESSRCLLCWLFLASVLVVGATESNRHCDERKRDTQMQRVCPRIPPHSKSNVFL